MRILAVDDSEDARDLTEGALHSAGYDDVVTAASAWEALRILDVGRTTDDQPSVDVVLLDIVMPEMDGIEACARIRSDARYADVPILMVTSLEDVESLSNAFVAGASDYITKPVNRIELVARVRAALKLKSELERRQARERELLAFMATWGDRRATLWIDEATGLFVGEVAEAYLMTETKYQSDNMISILALSLDHFEAFRSAHGEDASRTVLGQVAHAVRGVAARIGVIAAAYRNGLIVLVAPEVDPGAACQLGETLRNTVARLKLKNGDAIATDHMTASVSAVTGTVRRGPDRAHLLTHAIATVQQAAEAGGNRLLAVTV
jgi:sigma-B regulation protein RsbU (phosphoserine phosphatase)